MNLLKTIMRDLTALGGTPFYLLLTLTILFIDQRIFIDLIFGFIVTLVIVVGIRTFYFKSRPNKQKYNNFIEKIDASSFPSWHSARIIFLVFALTSFLLLRIIFGLIAVGVMYSRIYLKKHDSVDILGGVILGLVTFWLSTFL